MNLQLPPVVDVSAFERLKSINENNTEESRLYLRVAVLGGGCSGFSYELDLVKASTEGDLEISDGEQSVFIDEVSLPFLANAINGLFVLPF